MNHMKEVAKMLGVEMGEKFKIKNSFSTDTYWFERWGIALCYSTIMKWGEKKK